MGHGIKKSLITLDCPHIFALLNLTLILLGYFWSRMTGEGYEIEVGDSLIKVGTDVQAWALGISGVNFFAWALGFGR